MTHRFIPRLSPEEIARQQLEGLRFTVRQAFKSPQYRKRLEACGVTPDDITSLDDLRRHLDHFLALGGEGHLALGADLDGCEILPEGFAAVDDYNALGDYLVKTGYSDETIQNLFCNSLRKVVTTCIM